MARDLGGFRQCLVPGCGARVPIREDRSGRIYYKCLGISDSKQCGFEGKFGKDMGAMLRTEIEAEQTKEMTGDDTSNSPDAGREIAHAQTIHGDQPASELDAGPEPVTGDEAEPSSEPEPEHWSGL